jgi:O-acetyl-ADP-ribose deacetylase (regulator of RNase III)
MQKKFGTRTIALRRGDITRESTDAIVNAANSSLLGGGGVDGAIHRAGGPAILEECKVIRAKRGSLPAGRAVITSAGHLPCRHVIHTVGPVWNGGTKNEPELLASCYRESLKLAAANGIRSIAFPSISTGAFGYPVDAAAGIALTTVRDTLPEAGAVEEVRFVLFSDPDLEAYSAVLESLRGRP